MPNIRSIHISFNSANITTKTHSLVKLSKKYNVFISFVYNITDNYSLDALSQSNTNSM